jgi:tripeptidyl-peptidase-1
MVLYVGGSFGISGGTSASTPIFASIVNCINEERIAAGKSPVGFVNPVLYQNPGALNDIINGTNPGCGVQGFPAVVGWDPSSGLGTPNYPKLLKLFLSLP